MSFTTFSGPVRAGTVRDGAARNTGLAMLTQSYDSGNLTSAIGNYDYALGILPQGAQIVNILMDQVVVAGTGTMTISVGSTSGGAELAAATNTSAGGRFTATTTATTQLAWQTSTSADTPVYVRIAVGTGTLTSGRVVVTVVYVQRSSSGAQNPASA
jgi:hypothetical protein